MTDATWVIEEVALIVADYRQMQLCEFHGHQYNKAEHNRQLQARTGRTRGSIERKHQNISAVLRDADCFYIPGYKPLGNYQSLLVDEVDTQMLSDATYISAARAAAQQAVDAKTDVDFYHFDVEPPKPTLADEAPVAAAQRPYKQDYLAREARNHALGLAGEVMVVSYERHRLRQLGKHRLADRVEHVAQSRGDGLGFDVLSFEDDGRERFVEVKSTGYGKELPFYMSHNEVEFSTAQQTQYYLCRVFDLHRTPRMFTLHGDMREQLRLDPVNYRARLGG